MKKYLFLICLLFPLSLRAETFVEALGAECSRILYNMRETSYPEMFDNELKRNMNFSHIEKCLETYKNNGGNIEKLNEKFNAAIFLAEISFYECVKKINENEKNKQDKELYFCNSLQNTVFVRIMRGKECSLYIDKYDTYNLNDVLQEKCKIKEQ